MELLGIQALCGDVVERGVMCAVSGECANVYQEAYSRRAGAEGSVRPTSRHRHPPTRCEVSLRHRGCNTGTHSAPYCRASVISLFFHLFRFLDITNEGLALTGSFTLVCARFEFCQYAHRYRIGTARTDSSAWILLAARLGALESLSVRLPHIGSGSDSAPHALLMLSTNSSRSLA